MINLLLAACVLGGISSMHCVGMCGPLALSLPAIHTNNQSKFVAAFLYNFGRVVTYSSMGVLFGFIGKTFAIFGFQQLLSFTAGILILALIFLSKNNSLQQTFITKGFHTLRKQLAYLFTKKNYQSVFFIGILNGLLPCGFVYMALAGASATGSITKSALFMAAFGLGTFPVMWSLAFFGSYISMQARQSIKRFYPYLMFAMAILLILRGLGLAIPFVSPALSNGNSITQQTIECHIETK